MEEKGTGMQTGYRGAYEHCEAIKEVLVRNMIEIDHKKRGLDPQVPGLPAKWPADKVVRVMCGCMIVT